MIPVPHPALLSFLKTIRAPSQVGRAAHAHPRRAHRAVPARARAEHAERPFARGAALRLHGGRVEALAWRQGHEHLHARTRRYLLALLRGRALPRCHGQAGPERGRLGVAHLRALLRLARLHEHARLRQRRHWLGPVVALCAHPRRARPADALAHRDGHGPRAPRRHRPRRQFAGAAHRPLLRPRPAGAARALARRAAARDRHQPRLQGLVSRRRPPAGGRRHARALCPKGLTLARRDSASALASQPCGGHFETHGLANMHPLRKFPRLRCFLSQAAAPNIMEI
eukprot:6183462-Pleurochrysis_carterae.AAC.3